MNMDFMLKSVAEVRKEEGLPSDGRGSLPDLERLEAIFRRVMAPDIPVYDVASYVVDMTIPLAWAYTEGFGTFIASPMSAEVNLRLALDAVLVWNGTVEHGRAEAIARSIADKWAAADISEDAGAARKIWFPPGEDLSYMVSGDNVRRAFETDAAWMCKPHPVTPDDFVHEAFVAPLGPARVYPKNVSGMALLRQADVVGYTTASEMGLVAGLLGKGIVDFTLYSHEARGRYYALYRAIRQSSLGLAEAVDRLLSCPWSGYVPLDIGDADATERFAAFKVRALEIHARCRPLVDLPPKPEN